MRPPTQQGPSVRMNGGAEPGGGVLPPDSLRPEAQAAARSRQARSGVRRRDPGPVTRRADVVSCTAVMTSRAPAGVNCHLVDGAVLPGRGAVPNFRPEDDGTHGEGTSPHLLGS